MDEGLIHRIHKRESKKGLGTKIIGQKVYSYDWVTSTNDLAHFFAQHHTPEGTVVFAKGQTHGRGRMGNVWTSPYDKGLYFSFVLRPHLEMSKAGLMTLVVALGVVRALKELHVDHVTIKWPNDVFIKNKKACGILTELNFHSKKIVYCVVGVGLNVHRPSKSDCWPCAISLEEATARKFDTADLAHIILKKIDDCYELLRHKKYAAIMAEVKENSRLVLGGRVRVTWEDKEVEGYAVDFDENGSLLIRRDNGFLEKVSSGHLVML